MSLVEASCVDVVAIDATIVRMVLVPASMALMGRANWWLPGWLDRVLPHLDLESDGSADLTAVVPAQGQSPDAMAPLVR